MEREQPDADVDVRFDHPTKEEVEVGVINDKEDGNEKYNGVIDAPHEDVSFLGTAEVDEP